MARRPSSISPAYVAQQFLLGGKVDERRERHVPHRFVHACGVAQAHDAHARAQQALSQIVDCDVARRAGEHLLAASHHLPQELDEGRGLAGARWPMDQGHVLGLQREVHRVAL